VKGICIKANKPIDFKSTSAERNQAGTKEIRIYSGKPELKPVSTQIKHPSVE